MRRRTIGTPSAPSAEQMDARRRAIDELLRRDGQQV